jgi:hypothetical protein
MIKLSSISQPLLGKGIFTRYISHFRMSLTELHHTLHSSAALTLAQQGGFNEIQGSGRFDSINLPQSSVECGNDAF